MDVSSVYTIVATAGAIVSAFGFFGIRWSHLMRMFKGFERYFDQESDAFIYDPIARSLWEIEAVRAPIFAFFSYFLFLASTAISYVTIEGCWSVEADPATSWTIFWISVVLASISLVYMVETLVARKVMNNVKRKRRSRSK